jgi:hypothetical protein
LSWFWVGRKWGRERRNEISSDRATLCDQSAQGGDKIVLFSFASGYLVAMRDPRLIRTREDLLRLIADAVRLQITYLPPQQAHAVADTVLRAFKAAGLSIRRRGVRQ